MSALQANPFLLAGGKDDDYVIERSLRFDSSGTPELVRSPGSAGNTSKFTISFWCKRTKLGSTQMIIQTGDNYNNLFRVYWDGNDNFRFHQYNGSAYVMNYITNARYRDPSAWYHFVIAIDTTLAAAADRARLYVNGVEVTDFGAEDNPNQNLTTGWNSTVKQRIGREYTATYGNYYNYGGYVAEFHNIDGQALAPTDFGKTDNNGVWQPIKYSGSHGTNGFYLDFKDNSSTSALGNDAAGSNNFTVSNFSVTAGAGNDSLRDSPSHIAGQSDSGVGGEVVGNYATLNPIHHLATATLANGNLQTTSSNPAFSTFLLKSGKWYCEHTVTATGYNLCFSQIDHPAGATPSSSNSESIGWYTNGSWYWQGGNASAGASYGIGDVLGAAIDMDNTTITLYKNGTQTTSINFSSGYHVTFAEGMYVSQFNGTGHFNFGQRAFAHTAPSGYKCLCTANLPEPTIADGSQYFDTKLWTGQGNTNDRTLTVPFSADLVWTKSRSNSVNHALFDSVRGFSENALNTNSTSAETATTKGGYVKSVSNTSLTLAAATSNGDNQYYNGGSYTYVGWLWNAGSSNTTIAAGSLNSSVYDQSQKWSNDMSAEYSNAPYKAFDGDLSTYAHASASAGTMTWTPTGGYSYTNSVRVYAFSNYGGANSNVYLNGGSAVVVGASNGWVTVATGSGTITSISNSYAHTYRGLIVAIEVDGKILIDSDQTPPNVPSIASTVRANPSAGFSIVKATIGSGSVGHGLNALPSFVITKTVGSGIWWTQGHVYPNPAANWQRFNETGSLGTDYSAYNNTAATSTTFDFNSTYLYGSSQECISYCFAPVEGYSAMGSYTGNGSANGTFVYTGFKPEFVLVKNTTSAQPWQINDAVRNPSNLTNLALHPHSSGAEQTYTSAVMDIVSNGFKLRGSDGHTNSSGNTYIYLAFASNPFKTARAR